MYLLYIYILIFSIDFIYFIQIICVMHICYKNYVVITGLVKPIKVDEVTSEFMQEKDFGG